MNILHVATINKPISPSNGYGPIESVIYNIDKGLTGLGHRSIVACSEDSRVVGEKWPTLARSLGDYCRDRTPAVKVQVDLHLQMALARARRGDVDAVHMHEWQDRAYSGEFDPGVPIVLTLHVPANVSGMAGLREQAARGARRRSPVHPVAISEYQRRQYQAIVDVPDVIPHGIEVDDYLFRGNAEHGAYLLHIGRITEDKGQDIAIEVARRAGMKLVLAGCVQNKEEDRAFFKTISPSIELVADVSQTAVTARYYDDVMKPILASDSQVIYVGELAGEATKHWYRHAYATLFPIRWGEPFGMVLIESMASGTPVVAFGEGAVPEIVKHGETGFVTASVDAMVAAVARVDSIDRRACRAHVQTNFSTRLMAARYASLYRRLAPQTLESNPHRGRSHANQAAAIRLATS